jgi:membrane protein YqaA with SNARE-associated domain
VTGKYSASALLAVATAGNVLGSLVNWLLGRYIERWRHNTGFRSRTTDTHARNARTSALGTRC